ncbi:MAG: hypothetical protein AAF441_24605 [Pseudomonadota bacterium]
MGVRIYRIERNGLAEILLSALKVTKKAVDLGSVDVSVRVIRRQVGGLLHELRSVFDPSRLDFNKSGFLQQFRMVGLGAQRFLVGSAGRAKTPGRGK